MRDTIPAPPPTVPNLPLDETNAATDALDAIAKLCGCPSWQYPGQVMRDVEMMRDALHRLVKVCRQGNVAVHGGYGAAAVMVSALERAERILGEGV